MSVAEGTRCAAAAVNGGGLTVWACDQFELRVTSCHNRHSKDPLCGCGLSGCMVRSHGHVSRASKWLASMQNVAAVQPLPRTPQRGALRPARAAGRRRARQRPWSARGLGPWAALRSCQKIALKLVNPFPTLVLSDRTRIYGTVASFPRAVTDPTGSTSAHVWARYTDRY